VTGFHWVMERPDSVSRVAPPISTMRKTRPATAMSQNRTARRSSKLAVWATVGALWVMAMRDARGFNPELLSAELKPRLLSQTCPRHNAALSAGGRSACRGMHCDWIRRSGDTKAATRNFAGDNWLAKTEFYAMSFLSTESSQRVARAGTDRENEPIATCRART
jgi:hypothetical protein